MKEASEGQMLRNLLGPYARIVAAGAPAVLLIAVTVEITLWNNS